MYEKEMLSLNETERSLLASSCIFIPAVLMVALILSLGPYIGDTNPSSIVSVKQLLDQPKTQSQFD